MPNCTGAGFNLSHDWKCQVFGTSIRARARGFVLTGNARPVPGGLGPYSDPKTRLRRASLSVLFDPQFSLYQDHSSTGLSKEGMD